MDRWDVPFVSLRNFLVFLFKGEGETHFPKKKRMGGTSARQLWFAFSMRRDSASDTESWRADRQTAVRAGRDLQQRQTGPPRGRTGHLTDFDDRHRAHPCRVPKRPFVLIIGSSPSKSSSAVSARQASDGQLREANLESKCTVDAGMRPCADKRRGAYEYSGMYELLHTNLNLPCSSEKGHGCMQPRCSVGNTTYWVRLMSPHPHQKSLFHLLACYSRLLSWFLSFPRSICRLPLPIAGPAGAAAAA